jgi:hypothetical protein
MNPISWSVHRALALALCVPICSLAQQDEARPSQSESTALQRSKPHVSREVAAVLSRVDLCIHLEGETNGDRSERDREINEELRRNRCDTVAGSVHKLKLKYKSGSVSFHMLETAEKSLSE